MDKYNVHSKKIHGCLSVFSLLYLLFLSGFSFAQEAQIEYKIKAGYLYNFTKFITWPEDELATFNLCIVGKDPFGSIIDPIERKSVKSKPIRLYRFDSSNEIKHCHMIYFASLVVEREWNLPSKAILTITSLNKTLTVGESKSFIKAGGMIAFSLEEKKVKLKINIKAFRASGLDISAKLLEVADIYDGVPND
ncbi:MAG: YfiR family protein [Methylococcales bacterium]|nr:YfiR family protein [Methylococcales bacterium]